MAPSRYKDVPTEDKHAQLAASFSDSEDDDDTASIIPRTSTELAAHDHEILDEEEEREKLLRGELGTAQEKTFFQRLGHGPGGNGRKRSSKRTSSRYRDRDEKGQMMYEMEEGGPRGDTPVSSSESEEERDKVGIVQVRRGQTSCCTRIFRYTTINLCILITFLAIAFGAYKATRHDKSLSLSRTLASNGTHSFANTTILLSLDGFRADFLRRGLTPTLNAFIQEGVSPAYMTPSFPSVTFPNHYTLVTGLYPESHGVVGNTFFDPELNEEFYYTDASAMQSKWWRGEPLWVTAEKQGVRVATHMWPGSEAHISADFEPSFVDKFNGTELLDLKVDRIMSLLDKPGPDLAHLDSAVPDQRPQLIVAYVPNVDAAGHKYGPNSTDIRATISSVDNMLALLLHGLRERNLTDIVNIVVVSDHGMATTSTSRLIQFEDLVEPSLIEHIDGWPHYGLRPKDPAIVDMLYDHLLRESHTRDGFDVYTRANMPERFHFSANERIAPLWIIPKTGWAIVTYQELNVAEAVQNGDIYHPRGLHGYDHEHPLMRAIFVARGPAFPHVGGSKLDVFQNTEVYNILCDSVGVEPNANNGTLRLPFVTTGLHGVGEGEYEGVADFKSDEEVADEGGGSSESSFEGGDGESEMDGSSSSIYDDADSSSSFAPPEPEGDSSPPAKEQDDNPQDESQEQEGKEDGNEEMPHKDLPASWMEWFKQKIQDTKEWIADQFSGKYSGKVAGGPPGTKEILELHPGHQGFDPGSPESGKVNG